MFSFAPTISVNWNQIIFACSLVWDICVKTFSKGFSQNSSQCCTCKVYSSHPFCFFFYAYAEQPSQLSGQCILMAGPTL